MISTIVERAANQRHENSRCSPRKNARLFIRVPTAITYRGGNFALAVVEATAFPFPSSA